MGARRRVSPFMIWAEIISQIPAKKLAAAAASTVNALLLLLLMLESLQAFWSRSSTIHALANFEKFTRAFLAPNSSPKSVSGRLVVDKSGHLYILVHSSRELESSVLGRFY